ncbi:DUF614 domain-containing protein [Histoplasma capsulatum G186AR]|uniref:DUF614 domain-containing protein n=1 Tax=Ajellomyces capsulatus (strain G186AR / H82 / ATCC MYA-2454 / RMSCC 2432) TaxID=447093 RepID=C0NF94_AJECG|nr:DUF614 domain-containing protein [Histoplasma capsulatum G186AR]EEH09915.1 DUF614 domain-containing protein [Histoplasma capsulatum G186AR]
MRPQVQVLIEDNNYEPQNARNRYSYLNTPAELHAPTFPQQNKQQRHPSLPANAAEPPPPPPLDHYSHPRPSSYMPTIMHQDASEKSMSLHHHPQNAPPLSEHPAQFAPYADSPTENTTNAPHDSKLSPFPQSPPRIAIPPSHDQFANKAPSAAQEQERREKILAIVPDSNPLESHTPPTKYKPQAIKPAYMTPITIPDTHHLSHFPGQVAHPNQRLQGDTWNHGLCDCSDIGTCCLGLFWLLATIQHSRTRRAYGIPGSIPSDCVRATCCTCCTLIQDEKEIKTREEGARQTVSTPYLPPSHMTFSPPLR